VEIIIVITLTLIIINPLIAEELLYYIKIQGLEANHQIYSSKNSDIYNQKNN